MFLIHFQMAFKLSLISYSREQKEIGAWCLLQSEKGYEALAMAVLTRFQGWSREEVVDLIERTMVETRNPNIHPLHNLYVLATRSPGCPLKFVSQTRCSYVVYGRKPE
jgi:hypothetical protein